jgi:hypothetical protein
MREKLPVTNDSDNTAPSGRLLKFSNLLPSLLHNQSTMAIALRAFAVKFNPQKQEQNVAKALTSKQERKNMAKQSRAREENKIQRLKLKYDVDSVS